MPDKPDNSADGMSFGDHARVTIAQGRRITVGSDGTHGGRSSFNIFRWIAGILAAVIAGLLVAWLTGLFDGDAASKSPGAALAGGRTVTVDNRIVIGAHRMSEDESLRLFTAPAICRSDDCVVPHTSFYTGDKIAHVVCQTRGDWVTNSNLTTHADDRNPGKADSRLWYGVKLDNGRRGFFSAVWAAHDQRNGLQLPNCRSAQTQE